MHVYGRRGPRTHLPPDDLELVGRAVVPQVLVDGGRREQDVLRGQPHHRGAVQVLGMQDLLVPPKLPAHGVGDGELRGDDVVEGVVEDALLDALEGEEGRGRGHMGRGVLRLAVEKVEGRVGQAEEDADLCDVG